MTLLTLSVLIPVAISVAVPVLGLQAAAFAIRVLFAAAAVRVGGAHLLHGRGAGVCGMTACRVALSLCGQTSARLWPDAIGRMRRVAARRAYQRTDSLSIWALGARGKQVLEMVSGIRRQENGQCVGGVAAGCR